MIIRKAENKDLEEVLRVERDAFGYDKEAELVNDMLNDKTAEPRISLLAFIDDKAVGHILFSKATLENANKDVTLSLLAPLAIVPEEQNMGIGAKLIAEGLKMLKESGVDLVFVLGHPGYYPKSGFEPAGKLGLDAPYPIPEEVSDAWMVQALRPNLLGNVQGTLKCCDAINQPEHWRE